MLTHDKKCEILVFLFFEQIAAPRVTRASKIKLHAWCEVTTRRFGVYIISLVGGYRRCPIAISPNLSNLQPTVHQITVEIERMHDGSASVDVLAVGLLSPPLRLSTLSLVSLPLYSQMSQTAML